MAKDNEVKIKFGFESDDGSLAAAINKVKKATSGISLTETGRGAIQASRDQDRNMAREKAGLDMINRALEIRKARLAEILKMESQGLDVVKQRERAEERLENARRMARIQQTNFEKVQGVGRGGGAGGGGIGKGLPPGGITSLAGLAQFLGIAGPLVTGVAMGRGAEGIRKFFGEAQYRATVNEASAFNISGQGGQRIASMLSGGAAEDLAFNPLRIQAAKNAEDIMKGRMESSVRLFKRPIQTIFGAANNGYEFGNQWGLGTNAQKRDIEAQQAIERGEAQRTQFEALKTGPDSAIRTAVTDKFLQTYQRDLDFQRQMGLTTAGFRGTFQSPTGQFTGGFLGDIQDAGFKDEQGMAMASSIMGAGGSTRAATGSAALALQAQRNLDITNSGNIMGKLSGSLGSSGATNEAFVKLLAEGTRVGLDGSQFRDENRKFIESAADVISKSGVTTSGGIDQILDQFSKFFGDKTSAGIEAGKGAYELYRQTSMSQTGPNATMRAAGMMTNPILNKLGTFSRAALFNMPFEQVTSDNLAIKAMAAEASTNSKTPITAEDLVREHNKIVAASANIFRPSDITGKNLATIKKKYNVNSAIGFQGPLSSKAYDELGLALGQAMVPQMVEHKDLAQNQRQLAEYTDALSSQDVDRSNKALEDAKRQQLGALSTGRPEDEINRVQAEASRLANQLFMSIKDSILSATGGANEFAAAITKLLSAMRGASPAEQAKLFTNFNNTWGMAPTNQSTAGSPAHGGGTDHP